ncbi:TBC domain-containing protein [Cryptosporidium muris RN66]|uniref:TBC domain-containing protein n=1 Tax=Cryptosporidium muris (strain RN66) TaxID=441375 RepID=B6AG75_CRYMR|nr:TBC domain-containing protein [Cryptosporidium muris RN66]EEA07216.1 TBC domain-containing protein [Cryptosporidium muris RN66]|eukprot:XP_002141565.1 TBC domain-containing protein [Cryptosporidium muris RN66]
MSTDLTTSKVGTVRLERFTSVLGQDCIDLEQLQNLLWSGVPISAPPEMRRDAWQIMLGYLPPRRDRHLSCQQKKIAEYKLLVKEYIQRDNLSEQERKLLRQIKVDLPRTSLEYKSLKNDIILGLMERVLFLWAIRNPASGYVQGINDLLCPFLIVFFLPFCPDGNMELFNINEISSEKVQQVEAEIYWCLTRLLDSLQENYVSEQPGIHKLILYLRDIIRRIDNVLYNHLKDEGVDFLQFAFRWMNCLLTREFPLNCVVRLWDTYIAENTLIKINKYNRSGSVSSSIAITPTNSNSNTSISYFNAFHVYVCSAFLLYWTNNLRSMDFANIMLFLQNLPTENWTERDIDALLAQAYVLQTLFHCSPRHLLDYSKSNTIPQ